MRRDAQTLCDVAAVDDNTGPDPYADDVPHTTLPVVGLFVDHDTTAESSNRSTDTPPMQVMVSASSSRIGVAVSNT
jgi:hypothetical protein